MPHKNPGRADTEPGQKSAPKEQNLQSAYQIHTLAQIMYGQLYGAQPWIGPTGPAHLPYAAQPWTGPADPAHLPYAAQPWTPLANPVGGPWGPEVPSWTAPPAPSYAPPTGFHGLPQQPSQWPPFFGYGCGWRHC